MTRLYMLDTNTVSYIVTGRSPMARVRLASLAPDETACISVITEAELLYGVQKTGGGERKYRSLQVFLARLKVYGWDRSVVPAHAALRSRQEALGKTLGPLDTQITAHSIALGATLVSSDKAFQHVPDLAGLESWVPDLAGT